MKKTGAIFAFLLFAILIPIVSAANQTTEEKGYACLEGKVSGKCSTLILEEQEFSLLALSYNSNILRECKTAVESKRKNNECWPNPDCKIKDTSLAVIALKNLGEDTSAAESWILKQNKTPSNLEWYLEIDSSQATECTITYDSIAKRINIADDKKISGELGSCFSFAYDNYWLKISNSCLRKKFSVSCNKDFLSTILFKKTNSPVWHVSSDVKAASSGGTTEHEVNSYCFSPTSSCNYEDNLWAALALSKTGHDSELRLALPYLIVMSEDNEKLFPSSFLYYLTSSEDYLSKILSLQKSGGYWELNQRYYDTALGLLALGESEAETKARTWLGSVQGNDGCWNSGNIRDTAFLLWAGWPRNPASVGGGNASETADCQDYNFFCLTQGECDEAEGNNLRNYDCSGMKICCDKPKKQKTCSEEDGNICPTGKVCSVSAIETSDTAKCCIGECKDESEETECEIEGNTCRNSCGSGEEEASFDCETGKTCCKEIPVTPAKSKLWIWILAILIILAILGITFKDKLRILIFRMKGGFKQGDVNKTRPPFMPPSSQYSMRPRLPIYPGTRPVQPIQPRPPIQKPIGKTKTDQELEDTLKKLKDMSE